MYHNHQFCGRTRCVVMTLLLLCLLVVSVSADEFGRNSLDKGASAFQFGISQNQEIPDIGTFLGTTLSYKKHYTSHSCIRFGLSTEFDKDKNENEEHERLNDGTSIIKLTTIDQNLYYISITCQYIYYPSVSKKIVPFLGGGPLLSYSYHDQDKLQTDYLPDDYIRNTTFIESTKKWSLGFAGAIGIEWFMQKNISLHTEYTVLLAYFSDIHESSIIPYSQELISNTMKYHQLKFKNLDIRIGFTAYF